MEEKFLRNRAYNKIANRRVDASTNLWHVDDFLSHMIAILYPYVRDNSIETIEKFSLVIEVIKSFRHKKNDREFLDSLTELSLIEVLKDSWIPRLDDKNKLASIFIVVDYVDESGFVHVKEKLWETYRNISSFVDNIKYGDQEYVKPQIKEVQFDIQDKNIHDLDTNVKKSSVATIKVEIPKRKKKEWAPVSEEEKAFVQLWESLGLPDHIKEGEYIWDFGIEQAAYDSIKSGLISLNLKNNYKIVKHYAFHIVVFLAEWFKREYDGHLCERGLEQLGLQSTFSRKIWENANIPQSYLLNSGQNEWLYSMYVLGGFPVKYVCRVKRFDSLLKDIWTIRQDEEFDEETIESISDSFDSNNSVYQYSLMPGGSLYEYINELLDDHIPLAESDKQIEPFSTYCQQLYEGKKQCYDHFFTGEWLFYTDGESQGLDCEFKVQIGSKKNRCYIPYDCVRSWNKIQNWSSIEEFCIGLETNNGEKSRSTVRFSKTGDGKYPFVGWGMSSSITLEFDIVNLKEVRVVLYNVEDINRNEGITIHSFKARNHYQVYQTNNSFKWTTRTANSSSSALLFSSQKYIVSEEEERVKELVKAQDDYSSWNWIEIHNNVTLTDIITNQELIFSEKKGSLGIIFKSISGVRYNMNGEVDFTYNDSDGEKTDSVPVMLGLDGIRSVKLYPFEREEKIKNIKNYKLEFKQSAFHYCDLTSENQPQCGIMQLRVSDGVHLLVTKCYFIPLKELLQRNIYNRTIKFLSDKIDVWFPSTDGAYKLADGSCSYNDVDYDDSSDVVPFRIGKEKEYLTIDVFRANNCREIYFNNKFLKTLSSSTFRASVPLILKDKFDIRTIGDDGVSRSVAGQYVLLDYMFKSNNGANMNISVDDNKAGISYYLYSNMTSRNKPSNHLVISDSQKDNYKFYYWSFKSDDDAIPVDCSYNPENKEFIVSVERLGRRRHGIIFQSLKDCCPPNYVFPLYPNNDAWRIMVNESFHENVIFKCFDIAIEHNAYFSQFYPIFKLLDSADTKKALVRVIIEYFRIPGNRTIKKILGMHRFASEFLFEWFLLPWNIWKENCKDSFDQRTAEMIFRNNPFITIPSEKTYLDMLLDKYWSLPHSRNWIFSRNRNISNLALQCMRGKDGDFFFLKAKRNKNDYIEQDHTVCIDILTSIHQSTNIYYELYKLIQDKIL